VAFMNNWEIAKLFFDEIADLIGYPRETPY